MFDMRVRYSCCWVVHVSQKLFHINADIILVLKRVYDMSEHVHTSRMESDKYLHQSRKDNHCSGKTDVPIFCTYQGNSMNYLTIIDFH